LARGFRVLEQHCHHQIATTSGSSGNPSTQTTQGWGVKAWVNAGLVVETTAAAYVCLKALGSFPGNWGSDHQGQHEGLQKDGDMTLGQASQETNLSTTVQQDQKTINQHVHRDLPGDDVIPQDVSLRERRLHAFEELKIVELDNIKKINNKKTSDPPLELLQAPTLQNPIPFQLIDPGEVFSLNLGNHPIFPNPQRDVFDAKGQRLTLNVTLADGDPLPEGLMLIPPAFFPDPIIISYATLLGEARGVTVVGSTVFVADGSSGLQVIDISNQSSPSIIGSVDTPGYAVDVTVIGTTAFVADGSSLQVIDISDLSSPSIIGSVTSVITPSWAYGVTVIDSTAFVAEDYGGLQVIDISNLTSPSIIGSVATPGRHAEDVTVVGSTAFVADGFSGLQVIDISDLSNPSIIGS